jgi:preprotein translocase subunit SecF
MLVLLALFFIGGELIHNFAIALMIGVGIGTYSSIYVAATVMLGFNVDREDLLEHVEGALVDDLP